jgi:hypothetical protein
MSNTTPCGLDGNIGFPYSFNGEKINVDLGLFKIPLDFSFGDMKTIPTLMRETGGINVNSSNTILYNKTKYELIYGQLCQPHSLWSLKDPNIVAEIVFTFITKDKSSPNPTLILLSYLIEKAPKTDDKNEFLKSMFSNIPPSKNISIMSLCEISKQHYVYTSCIPYLEKGKKIGGMRALCVVGERPIKVLATLLKQLNLAKYRLPSTILLTNDRQTIISYSIRSGGMANPVTSPTGETFINSINVNDDVFKRRFTTFEFVKYVKKVEKNRVEGFIGGGSADPPPADPPPINPPPAVGGSGGGNGSIISGSEPSGNDGVQRKALDQLKCYPIHQQKNIEGDMLYIDKEGRPVNTLDVLTNPSGVSIQFNTNPPKKSDALANTLGMIGGIIIGFLLILLITYYVYKTKKGNSPISALSQIVSGSASGSGPAPGSASGK